jgi:hypothetical protein
MYVIEKNIPAPRFEGRKKYPIEDLQLGDSFLVPGVDEKVRRSLTVCANTIAKKHNGTRKFTVRKVGQGFRVWRTA